MNKILATLFLFSAFPALSPPASAQEFRYQFEGPETGLDLGVSIDGAGDVNGDGVPDLVVGADWESDAATLGGAVRVYSGLDGTLLGAVFGEQSHLLLGGTVSGAGDVDGDGFTDVIAGALGGSAHGPSTGLARVYSGRTGAMLYEFEGDAQYDVFGLSVGGGGDVNGDGFDDVVVGAGIYPPDDDVRLGYLRVYSGLDGCVLYTFLEDSLGDLFPSKVSVIGDANGDGFDDVLASGWNGDPGQSDSGYARIYSGQDGSVLHTLYATGLAGHFGLSSGAAGDVDADGCADVVVGMEGGAFNGFVYGEVFSGRTGAFLFDLTGDPDSNVTACVVDGAGDVNGDGFDDVIAGDPFQGSVNGARAGAARVHSGADGSELFVTYGDNFWDYYGTGVAGIGDVDGDGFDDVAASSNEFAGSRGLVRVIGGSAEVLHLEGPAPGSAGGVNTFEISHAQPGSTLHLVGQTRKGVSEVYCTGGFVPVPFRDAKLLATVAADGAGAASIPLFVPLRFSGRAIRIEAVERQTCRFTNLVLYTFP